MDYSHLNRFDPKDREAMIKDAMQFQHRLNSVTAILISQELTPEEKVHALADIQKDMIKDQAMSIQRLWANDDSPSRPEPWTYQVHLVMKEIFTMQMGCQPSWDIESGSEEEYEPNPFVAGYIGTILALYKQTYPEYC